MSSSGSRFGLVGVLMGGYSSEREISLRSGTAVAAALSQAGHQATPIDVTARDKHKIVDQIQQSSIQAAFIALHGRLGEDGVIQSILDDMNIPYTGSGVQASQKAFNKTTTQKILSGAGLPVSDFVCVTDGIMPDFKEVFGVLKKLPFVVKAACEGSSIGISIVRHPSQWEAAMRDALRFGPFVLIERFIKGRELTAGVFDAEPLPLVEIKSRTGFFDFTAKYQKGMTQYVIPPELPPGVTQDIQQLAVSAHEALGCYGFSRVDIRLDEGMNPYILEVNTIPGFTETSLFPKAAKEAGYEFIDVCEKLLDLGYAKKVQR